MGTIEKDKQLNNDFFDDITMLQTDDLIVTSEVSPYYWHDEPEIDIIDEQLQKEHTKNHYTLVDLFCGAGGLSKGFEMTNRIQPILGVDIFRPAMETYRKNNPYTHTILGDIRKVSEETLRSITSNNPVNIIAAGVPCQGFSLSNRNRVANDVRNFLFLEVIRAVNELNPDIVVIENVSGMRSLENGQFIEIISDTLAKAGTEEGYHVEHGFLNAADFGVPQIRKRLFFVAVKKRIGKFAFPVGEYGPNKEKPYNTVRDAIGDLPQLKSGESSRRYRKVKLTDYQVLMRGNQKELYNHTAPNHPQETILRIGSTKPGEPMYPKYRQRIRLSWEIQSPTQLAGGIRPQFQFGHPASPRGLSVRERARLQSFPDDYMFMGGTVQGRVQTGNAVPPLLAKGLAMNIVKLLDDYYA